MKPKEILGAVLFTLALLLTVLALDEYGASKQSLELQGVIRPRP